MLHLARPVPAEPVWSLPQWAASVASSHQNTPASAAHPDGGFRINFRSPDLFSTISIDGDHIVMRGTEENTIAYLQRCLLIFCAIAIRA